MASQKANLANQRLQIRAASGLGGAIEILGLEDLLKELKVLPIELAKKVLYKGLQMGGRRVVQRASALAPYGATGALKASIAQRRANVTNSSYVVGEDVFAKRSKATKGGYYAHLVEYGHDIFRTTRYGKYFIKHYSGQRFMLPAIQQEQNNVIKDVRDTISDKLKNYYIGRKRL